MGQLAPGRQTCFCLLQPNTQLQQRQFFSHWFQPICYLASLVHGLQYFFSKRKIFIVIQ